MSISSLLPWALAVLLLAGAILNLSAPASVRRRYARLGYGQRLRYLVAGLELAASGLLAFPATRPIGAALAIAILSAIIGSALAHRQTGGIGASSFLLLLALMTTATS
ncbi:hypothetical protein LH128_19591 [Sphingomonas sp. LH128]|uniref:MauE/DoxX family redox-associated membrane protein n=1 Tax=Sphingomonas sp. LH128 TaxID=473781 RepID=UPI00027CC566|nr:DoxX family protein [Sphingomonas sp. LH128]EJU11305.1 hypothetical protein LH128_19591 [Sphingomonas sp. LH128]